MRQDFLTRFLGGFEISLRSTFSPTNFDLRLPTLSEDKKGRESKKGVEAFREKLIMH